MDNRVARKRVWNLVAHFPHLADDTQELLVKHRRRIAVKHDEARYDKDSPYAFDWEAILDDLEKRL